MKIKLLLSTTLSIILTMGVVNVNAQNQVKHPAAKKKMVQNQKVQAVKANHTGNMLQAHNVLKRTNKAIVIAHNAVKKGKNYTGDFAKAVHHQRFAKRLLKQHKAHRAMQHSRLARKYAFIAIRNNKSTYDTSLNFTDEENKQMGETITDAELEKELKADNPNISFDDSSISDNDMTEIDVLETDPADYKNE